MLWIQVVPIVQSTFGIYSSLSLLYAYNTYVKNVRKMKKVINFDEKTCTVFCGESYLLIYTFVLEWFYYYFCSEYWLAHNYYYIYICLLSQSQKSIACILAHSIEHSFIIVPLFGHFFVELKKSFNIGLVMIIQI